MADAAAAADKAQQEERVLAWLKKRGYTEVAKHYEEDQAKGGRGSASGDGGSELRRRIGEANKSALLFRTVELSDPLIYHRSYNEVQTWICNALEAYKPELLTVAFPVFVHSYLKLVERDQLAAAGSFLARWANDHREYYAMELRSLAAVQRPDQMQANAFVRRALADKFVLRLCHTSYRLLQAFLSDHNLLCIMEILNERVKVVIEDRAPRARFEGVTFMSEGVAGAAGYLGGAGGHGRSPVKAGMTNPFLPTVRWRVTKPRDDEDRQVVAMTTPLVTPFNTYLTHKLGSRPEKYLRGGEAASHGAGPSVGPHVADPANPTVLMASVANACDGLVTARFTEDATQLATGYEDRAVRVFRLVESTGAALDGAGAAGGSSSGPMVLRAHTQPVYGLAWSPDQQFLLSGSGDGTVRLWDVACGRNLVIYRTPTNFPVWDVSWAPLGHYFVAGSYDRVARVWSTNRTHPVRLLVGHYSDVSCVAWHPNCNYVVTGSWDKTARLWDMQSGRCLRIYAGHFGPMTALAVSPNGQFIAGAGGGTNLTAGGGGGGSGSGGAGAGASDGVIRIWEISTGREVAMLAGHRGAVHRLAFSADNTTLASAGADETVRTWDLDGDLVKVPSSISIAPHATMRTKGTPVYDVQYTRRNLLLACGAAP